MEESSTKASVDYEAEVEALPFILERLLKCYFGKGWSHRLSLLRSALFTCLPAWFLNWPLRDANETCRNDHQGKTVVSANTSENNYRCIFKLPQLQDWILGKLKVVTGRVSRVMEEDFRHQQCWPCIQDRNSFDTRASYWQQSINTSSIQPECITGHSEPCQPLPAL